MEYLRSQQQRKQTHQTLFGNTIYEIEHIPLPLRLRCGPSTTIPNYPAQCAINRAARIAKRRTARCATKHVPSTTNQNTEDASNSTSIAASNKMLLYATKPKRGRTIQYLPNNLSEISHDELQQWRHTEKQRRNREYANASIKRVRERIKHLEEEILSYQRKLTDVQNEIDKLQENPFGNSDTTSDKFAIGHRMGHRGTIKQPLKLQRGPIVPSRYFAINKNNIIHNDSEQSVPKSHQCTAMR